MPRELKDALIELKACLLEGGLQRIEELVEGLKVPERDDQLEAGELLKLLGECERLVLLRMEETKRGLEELRRQREGLLRYNEGRDLGP